MDANFLNILACPICKGALLHQPQQKRFVCKAEKLAFPIVDGVPVLLAEEATALEDGDLKEDGAGDKAAKPTASTSSSKSK